MRNVSAIFFLLSLGTIAHANAQQQKVFDCMNKTSFEVNSQCMASKISQNIEFREMQLNLVDEAVEAQDNAMATMKFYPQQMLIEIVAHRDADKRMTAAVKH